jgi:hypothetical protein
VTIAQRFIAGEEQECEGSPCSGRLKRTEISWLPFQPSALQTIDFSLLDPAVNCWAIIISSANADWAATIFVQSRFVWCFRKSVI